MTLEKTVEKVWISGHNEIRDNEVAHDLSRLEAKQPLMDPESAVGEYYTQIKGHF